MENPKRQLYTDILEVRAGYFKHLLRWVLESFVYRVRKVESLSRGEELLLGPVYTSQCSRSWHPVELKPA